MKSKLSGSISFLILTTFTLMSINACSERNETVACFPDSYISVTLDLNLPAYYSLQNVGSWIYVDEAGAGTRGLIIVRTTAGFKIYDRNAPHICPTENTTLKVEGGTKIVCPEDGAEWILLTGQPTAVANIPPKTYLYNYNSATNFLSIYN